MTSPPPPIGVAIVAFNSADVIVDCLDSLFASQGADVRVVIADNSSTDATCDIIQQWAEARGQGFSWQMANAGALDRASASLTLIKSAVNGGYAHGVNLALSVLVADPALQLFWVLNPDCVVMPDTAATYIQHGSDGQFSLMGGRTIYREQPDQIQTDGGRVSRWTGVCTSVHGGRPPQATAMPDVASIDYVTGANLVASRAFIDRAGLMVEDYFLYYEEVDWAFRRGDLPIRLVGTAIVHHHGGTTIGTGSTVRRASPFANYFNYRNRMRFVGRFFPARLPVAFAYAMAKAAQLMLKGAFDEAYAVLTGTLGLAPPAAVKNRIAPGAAQALAFGRPRP